MAIWLTDPVETAPVVILTRWMVFSVPSPDGKGRDRHFNGYNQTEGRVSSKIVDFDPEKMLGTTRSGRKYRLYGPPGFSQDAHYVLGQWLEINKVDVADLEDVTDEYHS